VIAGWGPVDRTGLLPTLGGVTAAQGFRAGGVASGVKPSGKPDLALVVAEAQAGCAVVTTTNLVKATACELTERHAADGTARAVLINSGNANVCTPHGAEHTLAMAAAAADHLDVAVEDVLVMSTGVIGVPLPLERITGALPGLVEGVTAAGGAAAAEAILTTDTHVKQVAFEVTDGDGGRCVVGGMAKGVGMIEPAMATLLVVLTTDAPVGGALARRLLTGAVRTTFNRISVDGDGSTSDTVALLASGRATRPPHLEVVGRALHAVCADLAEQIGRASCRERV